MKPISHDEYLSGKYKDVSTISGKHEAKVWYKDNGSIDEDYTYSDSYLRSKGLGRYAKKAESSSKSSSSKSSSSKSSSSKSSSSKSSGGSSFSLFGSGSKNNSSKAEEKVEEKTVYVDVEIPATDEERLDYLYWELSYYGDYNELKVNALKAKAESLGLDATKLLEKLEKKQRTYSDYEYAAQNKQYYGNIYPPVEREKLLKFIDFFNKRDKNNWDSNRLFNLDFVVRKHYENDAELRGIVDELKKQSEYYQNNSPFGTPIVKPKKGLIESLINLGQMFKN